jgi:phytoene dehydrogenase-like protein
MLKNKAYDAVVIGSGPNGLSAAITMQKAGLSVLLIEAKDKIGGGMRTEEFTLPGFHHDICSAIHPLGLGSPFFNSLPLNKLGVEWVNPPIPAAHPFSDGSTAVLYHSLEKTMESLQEDGQAYKRIISPLTNHWKEMVNDLLAPLHIPKHPLRLAQFGLRGLQSAKGLADRNFKNRNTRGLFAGMAAHVMVPLTWATTASIGLVLMALAHAYHWPLIKGGSQKLADALASHFLSMGGKIQTGTKITSLKQIPDTHAILFDIDPQQMLSIAGEKFSSFYKWQLKRYRFGMGVFKIDYALDGEIPFRSEACRQAGTVHLGGSMEEIADAEQKTWNGKIPAKPFVLLSQQSLFDPTRAPQGKQTAWAYCHVPKGSQVDMTQVIENQIEKHAPGFKDRVLARHTINASQYQDHNPNYVGGDINCGVQDIRQLFFRPTLRLSPYRTSAKGIYICSSATPPGGGVHGMSGLHAAKRALKDIFDINIPLPEL